MALEHSTASDVMAISFASRIPDFWTDQPRVWFIRLEAILAPQKLGDDAKFDLVISKLAKETICQLTDLIAKPPETGKFQAIKSKLINMFEESTNRQIEKLIGEMELGDQKPSQLLRRMKELARDKVPDGTLRVLWQGHLPNTVRAVLAVTETKDLDSLATVADNVAEVTRANQVAEVTVDKGVSDTAIILAEIAKLSFRMDDYERSRPRERQRSRTPRPRFHNRSRWRSSSRRNCTNNPDWLCFYHYRYRDQAHKCVQPCAWKEAPKN